MFQVGVVYTGHHGVPLGWLSLVLNVHTLTATCDTHYAHSPGQREAANPLNPGSAVLSLVTV